MEEEQLIEEFKNALVENKLYVDAREPPKIFNYLDRYGADYVKTLLPVGDFISGDICIERKEITDFIQSMRSGHLKKQLINMQNNFKKCYLIVSGDPKTAFANPYIKNWTVEHHLGSFASILVRFNIKIMLVANDSQLVNFIFKILKKSQDGKVPSIFETELMMLKATDVDIKTKMLMCLPLISKGKGQKLTKKLDIKIVRSSDGVEVDEKNFPWIPGIGDKTVEEIVKINKLRPPEET